MRGLRDWQEKELNRYLRDGMEVYVRMISPKVEGIVDKYGLNEFGGLFKIAPNGGSFDYEIEEYDNGNHFVKVGSNITMGAAKRMLSSDLMLARAENVWVHEVWGENLNETVNPPKELKKYVGGGGQTRYAYEMLTPTRVNDVLDVLEIYYGDEPRDDWNDSAYNGLTLRDAYDVAYVEQYEDLGNSKSESIQNALKWFLPDAAVFAELLDDCENEGLEIKPWLRKFVY